MEAVHNGTHLPRIITEWLSCFLFCYGHKNGAKISDYWTHNMVKWRYNKAFRITDPLWGESTGHRWISSQLARCTQLWYHFWYFNKKLVIWNAMMLMRGHCNQNIWRWLWYTVANIDWAVISACCPVQECCFLSFFFYRFMIYHIDVLTTANIDKFDLFAIANYASEVMIM